MGGCVAKSSFTVNEKPKQDDYSGGPILFCRQHLERVLLTAQPGEFLLYRDLDTGHILLTVRMASYIRHYRIKELGGLFYMQGQPYPYLDSILLYHRRHKLNGVRLLRQVHISAREVRAFAHRVAGSNGNFQLFENKNTAAAATAAAVTIDRRAILPGANLAAVAADGVGLTVNGAEILRRHSRASSDASLLTSSSGSANRRRR